MAEGRPSPQQLAGQAEQLRAHLEQATDRLEILTGLRDDKKRALQTLRAVKEGSPGDEILLPVGGSVFVNASLVENQKVIMGVGADYAMPRPIDKAVESLEKDVERLGGEIETLSQQAGRLEAEYTGLVQMLQSLQQQGES